MDIALALLSLIAGLAGLVWSAGTFVTGASITASNLGIRPFVIGLTVVAFGTSAPEVFTAVIATLQGVPELAIGNTLGSNIANIGVVLGITALFYPLDIPPTLPRKELPAMLLATGACLLALIDQRLSWPDGLFLLAVLAFFTWRVLRQHAPDGPGSHGPGEAEEFSAEMSTLRALGTLLIGLALLLVSANVLVFGAREIAVMLGISELVIGLTVVAIGTSLPELATTLTAAHKGGHQLALGNIVGSNIMNLLLVLPVPALLASVAIKPGLILRDFGTLLLISLVFCLVVFLTARKNRKIGRLAGTLFLLVYLAYSLIVLMTSQASGSP